MGERRSAAVATLTLLAAAVAATVATGIGEFPRGLVAVGLVALALLSGWEGIRRRGAWRDVLLILGALLLIASVVVAVVGGMLLGGLVTIGLLLLSVAAAARAFRVHVTLPTAEAPTKAVVVWNPRSGGGKAVTNNLADEARSRGIEPIELKPGDDLEVLVRDAVAGGADGLAAAGGDGTQALVASIAAEHDLPFACIPAGTRNHFALDLGVDRDDVVGALDAFVNGGERRVDLAEVNGRTFVNNVSLGLYAEAVQREGYRDAKLRTILDTAPDVLGPQGSSELSELKWIGPDGVAHDSAAVILVSNNNYRLGHAFASGTRPRIDDGVLGIAVLASPHDQAERTGSRRPWMQWTTQQFTINSSAAIPLGVDGEALVLESPLEFVVRRGALRVRIAPQHPGASPSAAVPDSVGALFGALVAMAAGRR